PTVGRLRLVLAEVGFFHLALERADEVVPGAELVGVVVHEMLGVHAPPEGQGLVGGVHDVDAQSGLLERAEKLAAGSGAGAVGLRIDGGYLGVAAALEARARIDETTLDETLQCLTGGGGHGPLSARSPRGLKGTAQRGGR